MWSPCIHIEYTPQSYQSFLCCSPIFIISVRRVRLSFTIKSNIQKRAFCLVWPCRILNLLETILIGKTERGRGREIEHAHTNELLLNSNSVRLGNLVRPNNYSAFVSLFRWQHCCHIILHASADARAKLPFIQNWSSFIGNTSVCVYGHEHDHVQWAWNIIKIETKQNKKPHEIKQIKKKATNWRNTSTVRTIDTAPHCIHNNYTVIYAE